MLFSKKAELDAFKKQQALLMREEKKMLKDLQEAEHRSKQESRRAQLQKIQDLEEKLLQEVQSKASRSRNSSLDLSKNSSFRTNSPIKIDHLDKMRELQEKARNMINGRHLLEEIPESPSKGLSETASPVKIPIMVPQSVLRKAQNLPPPTIQRVLKNGDVISVHLLSDKSRVNDPLVRAEAQVDSSEIQAMSKQMRGKPTKDVIHEIQKQFNNQNSRSESLQPKKKYKATISLPEADLPELRQCNTPKGKPEYYNFRDIALDMVSQQTTRSWVIQRMKQYSDKVKKTCLPKISQRKELEMAMMLEKLKSPNPKAVTGRVKLLV
jgi:hypothetical protein